MHLERVSTLKKQIRILLLTLCLAVAGIGLVATPARADSASWVPIKGTFNNAIGCTWNNGCDGGYHYGSAPAIDFDVPYGTPVYAAGAGTVVGSNNSCPPSTPDYGCSGGRGRYVEISHSGGRHSRYLHLSSVVKDSGSVSLGQLIGYSGNSGASEGAHLHYDELQDGTKVDPGPMTARHGSETVTYPAKWNKSGWSSVGAFGNYDVKNDSYSNPVTYPTFTPGVTSDRGDGVLQWDLRNSNTSGGANLVFTYGMVGTHTPIVGDWDGDGDFTPGVVSKRADGWWQWDLRNTNTSGGGTTVFNYGSTATDIPIVGDWDGDGDFTPGIYRQNGSVIEWHLRNSNTSGSANVVFTYGMWGLHTPIVGDWDGDGDYTPGVVSDRGDGVLQWDLRNVNTSGGGTTVFTYGMAGVHTPIVGDWDGDGDTNPGVYQQKNTVIEWHLRNSNTSGSANTVFTYGMWGLHTPIVGDWNG